MKKFWEDRQRLRLKLDPQRIERGIEQARGQQKAQETPLRVPALAFASAFRAVARLRKQRRWRYILTLLVWMSPVMAEHGSPVAGQPLVIDVRTETEYRQEHVREALNIPYDEIAGRIAAVAPDRATPVVLYCRSGRRSGIAEQALRRLGYRQIENRGGLDDMRRDGYRTD